MATRIAWWLNLDAARELEDPRSYGRPSTLAARLTALAPRMSTLIDADDLVLDGQGPASPAELALSFCPTPSALAALARLGYRTLASPTASVLRRVTCRGFAAQLGQTLPGASYALDMAQLERHLQQQPGITWLLKRDFAFAGRERRQVRGGQLDTPTLGFARRSFARGQGLQVEPLMEREGDFAQHGYLLADGELLLGPVMAQECDERGVWQRSRLAAPDELLAGERAELQQAVTATARALHEAGYFGPFGLDAFRYRSATGVPAFQPRCELNARFSMGYPRELLERALLSS
jgi:hypothetical protein